MRETGFVLKWTTAIALMVAVASAIAAHFNGVATATAQANVYTDKRVDEVKRDIGERLDHLEVKQDKVLDILTRK